MAGEHKLETTQDPGLIGFVKHPVVKVILSLSVFTVAIFVLHDLVAGVRVHDVIADIRSVASLSLFEALLATTVSYLAIAFYDVISLSSAAPGRVPNRAAYLIGAAGYAISNLLGTSFLSASIVRLRAYMAAGVSLPKVAIVLGTSWLGFWSGFALLFGGLMVFHPSGLSKIFALPDALETILGVCLGLSVAAFAIWLGSRGRQVSWKKFVFPLPDARTFLFLTVAGAVDILFAALCLWVLIPADVAENFVYFFALFTFAIGVGILSHSPGGLGVFEATMVAGLGAGARSDLLAALVLYRVVYTLYPFVFAALGLAVGWLLSQRRRVDAATALTQDLLAPIIPPLASGIALISGVLLLVSGSLPSEGSRLDVLRDILPLPVIEVSHLAASVTGIMLIVLARGLYRRLTRAWLVAVALLSIGIMTSLVRGLEWEQALTIGSSIAALVIFRSAFYRVEGGSVFDLNLNWFISVSAVMVAVTWVGWFAFQYVEYQDALWWQFTWQGDASRFLRGELAALVAFILIAIISLVHSHAVRPALKDIPPRVHDILERSDDAEAALVLMGDKEVLLSPEGNAFLAYSDTGRALIALGDPVGEAKEARRLIWDFREKADRLGRLCAFYRVSDLYLPTFLDMGLSLVKIGETARIDLTSFTLDGPKKKNFRYAVSRGARDGYRFEILPAADVAAHLPELRAISDAWLDQKQGREKSFALGAFSEGYIQNFDCAVLRNPEGAIVAFANLLPGGSHEVCVDLMRYDDRCPGYGMDLLFTHMILWAQSRKIKWFRLGNAPFSGIEAHRLASFWHRVAHLIYAHGGRLYRFEGLRAFKEKWDPVWSPHYLASPRGLGVPRVLYDVNVLISGGVRGLVRSSRQRFRG
ncbi:bifunctional lysylphosphatidylglycerol flippase/synthetase MprF [Celeribacter litoreus]|uniref:bifunctional lysylphosphatidylglycerol flippase/synthetase MprF n=1 Tax=Celeribacter litoreus TaxID=2876714 RepID=UPI001CCFB376|nr:bifunctional lysylphosphatidylglycerol flippase/synthetase MprF [Celeribacter litoreus]MCA0045074.1 bifunctional lysylphosphatidylglycerol flippase/synthetase MprF [Celeribacter litoreus]